MTAHYQTQQNNNNELTTILAHIQNQFYQHKPHTYQRDKKMLLYAITWPATWLKQRNLNIHQTHYNTLIIEKINDIKKYANKQKYEPYFPRYLLKTLQDHFSHNEEQLYYQLKHISYTLADIINNITKTRQAATINTIAHAHRILKLQYQKKTKNNNDPKQTILPL